MIDKSQVILSLVPGAEFNVIGIGMDAKVEWIKPSIAPITNEEIEQEFARLVNNQEYDLCKQQAKQLLAKTDWAVLPDVNLENQSEYLEYRKAIRKYIVQPEKNVVFPMEPTPIWK